MNRMRHLVGIDVPVLATADVVVLGADLGCLAAAVELRRAGLSVYVVEAGLSPVPDLCATGRYWIDGNDLAVELTGVAELIRRTVVGARAGTETIALWPDQVSGTWTPGCSATASRSATPSPRWRC